MNVVPDNRTQTDYDLPLTGYFGGGKRRERRMVKAGWDGEKGEGEKVRR